MRERAVMITSRHTYSNPVDKHCFRQCTSCLRCSNKGMKTECDGCSGHPDLYGERHPHNDHFCDCVNGVMRWVTKDGRTIVRRYMSNPYKGQVKTDAVSEDEQDWNAYLYERREHFNDPDFNPVKIEED
jgi:hypothetical protein